MSNTMIRLDNYEDLTPDAHTTVDCLRTRRTMPLLESLFVEIGKALYAPDMLLPPSVRPVDPNDDCPKNPDIVPSGDWDPDTSDKLPLIVVDIGDMVYRELHGFDHVTYHILPTAQKVFVRQVATSVVYQHLGKTKRQCMEYAAYTHDVLDAFAYAIKKHFHFENFRISSIVKPKYRNEYKDWESLVQGDLQYREAFELIQESQELKEIALSY